MRVIVALGNPFRGDDGVGPRVLELLRSRTEVAGILLTDDLLCLLDVLDAQNEVIVIDAVRGAEPAGSVLAWETPPAGELSRLSSHGLDLAEVLLLAGILERRPQRFLLLGVVGESFALGEPLSPCVEAAAQRLVDLLTSVDTEIQVVGGAGDTGVVVADRLFTQ